MADQEFLASFGVVIDESGVNRLQRVLQGNRALAEELASAFDRARQAAEAFFRDLSETPLLSFSLNVPSVTEEQTGIRVPFSLDFTRAAKELAAFFKAAGKSLRLTADASGVVEAGRNALLQLQAMFASAVLPLRAAVTVSSGAAGAAGIAGTAGSVLSSVASYLSVPSAAPAVTNSNTRTVSAPVSIQVTAAGSDPEAVGRSVYDVTEQYLLRTLQNQL